MSRIPGLPPGADRPRSVVDRSLHDQRRALIGWMIGVGLLAVWLMAMYPTIRDNADMKKLLESYPEPMRKLFHLDDFTSGPGYLRSEVFSFTVPVLFAVVAVLWGSDAIAGEEERHTLDLALANPISRRRFLIERWAAVVIELVAIGLSLTAVLAVAAPVVDLEVPWNGLSAALAGCVALAIVFATLALSLGAATGRRGASRGVTLAAVVAAYLIERACRPGLVAPADAQAVPLAPRPRRRSPRPWVVAGEPLGARGDQCRAARRGDRALRPTRPASLTRHGDHRVTAGRARTPGHRR